MLGAIIGDLAGSVYEYDEFKSRKKNLDRRLEVLSKDNLIEKDSFYSDDTILTIAILDAILNGKDYEGYLKKYGLFYYCNIATPYIIDSDVIKYIDYDLDLRVFPDGGYKVLDNKEYEYHKKIMSYPNEIDIIVKKELKKLIEMKIDDKGPFDKQNIEKYHDKYNELKKYGII